MYYGCLCWIDVRRNHSGVWCCFNVEVYNWWPTHWALRVPWAVMMHPLLTPPSPTNRVLCHNDNIYKQLSTCDRISRILKHSLSSLANPLLIFWCIYWWSFKVEQVLSLVQESTTVWLHSLLYIHAYIPSLSLS